LVNSPLPDGIILGMSPQVRFRSATLADVSELVSLMVQSSHGGIREAWKKAVRPGESWQERGAAELSDPTCEIGYPRFIVAEPSGSLQSKAPQGAKLAGMVLLNALGDTSRINPERESPEHVASMTLIKKAAHSLFIREFAVAEWARRQKLAQEFVALTATIARSNQLNAVTLIVNDANVPAYRLYQASGFREVSVQPSFRHPHFPDSTMLLLMRKDVDLATS
jgi:ribosomal protein S18 acetylase RimI-like enzyme